MLLLVVLATLANVVVVAVCIFAFQAPFAAWIAPFNVLAVASAWWAYARLRKLKAPA